ncbi:MAG: HYR domain-containing protein [Saprospiraceae bacterium]|nr:HYR domain-containing protein [Saprospiraceae bacterium]
MFILSVNAALAQTTVTFNYTGAMQSWVVPAGVTNISIETYGAQGENSACAGNYGGFGANGGFASGDLAVTPGQTLYLFVGGQSGYNGGGLAYCCPGAGCKGGNGGGASDLRVGGILLANRVIVAAGGGGGGGGQNPYQGGDGGAGGGVTGINGVGSTGDCLPWSGQGGFGGTQSSGGAGGCGGLLPSTCMFNGYPGSFGLGGNGNDQDWKGGGGGGGGYFGGGGGGSYCANGGGGGGSSYIGGVSSGTTVSNVNSGNGLIEISYDDCNLTCPVNITTIANPNKCSTYLDDLMPEICGGELGTRTALNFDGANDVVHAPDDVIPNTGEFTVMLWAKQNSSQVGSFRNIISQGRCFYIGHDNNNPPGVRIGDSWGNPGVLWPTDFMWHHYTVVRTASNAYLYIDGTLKATKGSPIDNPNCGVGWPHNLNIATQWTGASEHFNGDIDELQIWNEALDIKSIQCNMNQRMLGNEPGLTGYYDFEDGTGSTILTNKVNNAHNGYLDAMDPATDWVASPQPLSNKNSKNSFNNSCDASGDYPVGTTTVTWTVEDQSGTTETCSFTVTVIDNQKPTIACPANVEVTTQANECSAQVCYPDPTVTDNCLPAAPPGYTYKTSYGNSHYYQSNAQSNFTTAYNNAIAAGGHLASITSEPEKNAIAASGAGFAWIGGNDAETEGVWKWNNCEPFSYVNWCDGEPNGGAGENYLELEIGGCFNDLFHNANRFAILEMEGAKLQRTAGLAQNALFPLGNTNITYKATDAYGNTSTCTFKVTVQAANCGQPIQVYHKDTTTNSAKIKWNPGTPCNTAYQLRLRYEMSPGVWSSWTSWANKSGPGNEHAFGSLMPGTFYQYQIRSKCGVTNSIIVNGWFHTLPSALRKQDDGLVHAFSTIENWKNDIKPDHELTNVGIKAIPNPASEFVSLLLEGFDYGPKEMHMYDLSGKLIFRVQLATSENNPELDLKRLNVKPGLHMIRVSNGVNQKTIQLMVN